MMKIIQIVILVAATLFFSGCGICTPEIVEKKIYVKQKVPKLRILYDVKNVNLSPYIYDINATHYAVRKDKLREASNICKKKTKNLKFYKNQLMKYNRLFANK